MNSTLKKIAPLFVFMMSSTSWAYPNFPTYLDTAAKNLYGGGYSFSCTACHGNSGTSLATQFGVTFKSTVSTAAPGTSVSNLSQTQFTNVIKAMENLDSDGDGSTNKAELTAKTNPGDASSKPVTAPVCTAAKPTLTVSPSSQSSTAGGSVSYSLSLKNNDSTACTASTFAVTGSAPTGITATPNMGSVVLNPGASTTLSLAVKSGTTQASGSFQIGAAVSDSAQSTHAASVTGTLVIQAAATCTRAAPSVTIDPSSQTGAPGSTMSYKVTVLNKDSSVCAASAFTLSASALAPLTAQLSASSLNLAANQSGSVTVSVKADAGAAASSASFSIAVSDASVSGHTGSAQGQFVISGSSGGGDVTAPSAPTNVKLNAWRGVTLVRWSPSTDNVKVVKYQVLVDGVVKSETTRTWALMRIRDRAQAHSITVRALDAAGNMSLESSPVTLAPKTSGSGDRDDDDDGH